MKNFKIIGFDADDTLWVNEPYYREAEEEFYSMLQSFGSDEEISNELLRIILKNLNKYGYGIKSFMLSMIETSIHVSNGKIDSKIISNIISLGNEMINKPVILLDGIHEVLKELHDAGYKLIVVTKGDLLDQERKLRKSKLDGYFHDIVIMSDKKENDYTKLLLNLEIAPSEFLMVGNSLKSDILPVVNIGGYGVHIPFHTTWVHELIDQPENVTSFQEIPNIIELPKIISKLVTNQCAEK